MTDQPRKLIRSRWPKPIGGDTVDLAEAMDAMTDQPTTDPAVLGYIVLIHDDKRPGWLDGWDGEVHTDLSKARESLTAARKDGYEAVLAEQRAMEGE